MCIELCVAFVYQVESRTTRLFNLARMCLVCGYKVMASF